MQKEENATTTPTTEEVTAAMQIIAKSTATDGNTKPSATEVAAALDVVARSLAPQGNATPAAVSEVSAPLAQPAEDDLAESSTEDITLESSAVIPAEIVAELTTLFTATMSNPDFFAKESRVVALRNALKVPMFDDRSMQQFSVSAREELTRQAMDTAIKKQIVPVMPTAKEISVLAKKKFDDKQAKDAAKAAKKTA